MIEVVNKKFFRGKGVYVGRPSVLGNPFATKDSKFDIIERVRSNGEAIDKYRDWLRGEWVKNGEVRRELEKLARVYKNEGKLVLICWCRPARCHADVIADAIEKIAERL